MCGFIGHTVREAGPRGLFRGATPTLLMITPQMGVSFAVWEALKGSPPALAAAAPGTAATVAWQLGAGAIAGMTGKLVAFPLDTVKKRVQTAVRWRGAGRLVTGRGGRKRVRFRLAMEPKQAIRRYLDVAKKERRRTDELKNCHVHMYMSRVGVEQDPRFFPSQCPHRSLINVSTVA